jgi:photosystem II stability/assembly factor-like uncharacterized protein
MAERTLNCIGGWNRRWIDRRSVGMRQFTIGIGQHIYRSPDGGSTWSRSLREIPGSHTPIVRSDVDISRLPARAIGACWDFVSVLPCGFGVAVGHQAIDATSRVADVFITEDGARHWRQADPEVKSTKRDDERPVGRFASLALASPAGIVLAWDDPCLFDGSQSHVICSYDRGVSWEYHCLGPANPYLALDHSGRLLVLNDGYYLESRDGGRTWTRRVFVVEWPVDYRHERVALLRHVSFPDPGLGYALVVHWRGGFGNVPPPDVGLLSTTDDGNNWKHLHVFEGPNVGDVNERHILCLRVERANLRGGRNPLAGDASGDE